MESDKNYVAVGGFVLLVTVALIGFAVWLAGSHDKSKYTLYRIRFAESVNGLDIGSAVKFRGVGVGKVDAIAIDQADTRLIRVDVSVLKTTPIKTDTVASLKLQGITGVVYVELSGGSPQAPRLMSKRDSDRETIPEIAAQASSIDTIVNLMPEILQKVSNVADQVGKLFSDENVTAFHDTVADWRKISQSLAAQTGQLAQLLQNSNAVATDVHGMIENSKGDIKELVVNLTHTSQQLNDLIAHTNDAAGGQYQQLYQLLGELKNTSRTVSDLARSLQENPSRLIAPSQEKGIPAP